MAEHTRGTRAAEFAALTFLLVLAMAAVYLAVWGQGNKEEANTERSAKETAQSGQAQEQGEKKDLATQVAEACKAGGDVAKNLTQRGLCGKAKEIIQEPKVTPTVSVPQPTHTTTTVVVPAKGPSPAETLKAVTAYCAAKSSPCKGRAPTPAEVAAAVAAYCNPKGECRGKDGEQGEQGPGPTAEQVATGVVAFCSQDSEPCRGPRGADGRSVTFAIEAVEGGTKVTLAYSDGTGAQSFLIPDGKQGPSGPAGPAGPVCEAGSTPQKKEVMTSEEPTGLWVILCVLDDQTP